MNSYTLKLMIDGEEVRISQFVEKVFNEFIAPEYSTKGVNAFKRYINPKLIKERNMNDNHFLLTARDEDDNVIGVIEVRDCNHICLLFVDKKHHRKGIAKILYNASVQICKRKKDIKEITVNSSPYAVNIYRRLGFVIQEKAKTKDGIRFIPMKAQVSNE